MLLDTRQELCSNLIQHQVALQILAPSGPNFCHHSPLIPAAIVVVLCGNADWYMCMCVTFNYYDKLLCPV